MTMTKTSLSSAQLKTKAPVEWKYSQGLTEYPVSLAHMEERVGSILAGRSPEMVWLLEHPPLYTSGTGAKADDLLDGSRFPVYNTGRGGQFTYHGPGQRIAYVMLDLKRRNAMDVRAYVKDLEQWLIATLSHFGVESFTRVGRVGVWTIDRQGQEAKIAALGIRIRKWVTFHGISLNVHPDLSHYSGIVPCGIDNFGVTSLAMLGIHVTMEEVNTVLQREFERVFKTSCETVLPA